MIKSSSTTDDIVADSILDQAPASQYSIAANAAFQERRTRTLKQGDTFVVFDHRGNIGIEPGSTEGLYHRDTRILSKLSLLLEEARPLLLSSMVQDDNSVFIADLSNPDFFIGDQVALRREQVHLHRLMFVWEGACYERL
ncbi:MAG TPA: glycogen debranching N-terminal domain-containing protein, partial [Steroidobacteraceae bacterium]|nr:glycogen debranching N-terminal domain-containing protein [Steroidobacteraceae bacterium]